MDHSIIFHLRNIRRTHSVRLGAPPGPYGVNFHFGKTREQNLHEREIFEALHERV